MKMVGTAKNRPWETRFESKLLSVARDLRNRYDDVLMDAAGLKLSEALLLFYLQDDGPVNQSQLSLTVGIGRAQAGALVAKLCEVGLLDRVKDDSDGRAWLVRLTDEGHRRAELLRQIDLEVAAYVGSEMGDSDRRQLVSLLDRVQANLDRASDDSPVVGNSQTEAVAAL